MIKKYTLDFSKDLGFVGYYADGTIYSQVHPTEENIRTQLLYNAKNGITSDIEGEIINPIAEINSAKDIIEYFYRGKENGYYAKLTSYLSSMMVLGGTATSEYNWTSNGLDGGLPTETIAPKIESAINKLLKKQKGKM